MRPHRNRGLFSNYYLDELLPKEEEFKIPISEVKAVSEKVKGIWDRSRFEAINEDQLRKHFLDKVLDYLGWVVDVNAPVPTGEWSKRPDYALFQNSETLKTAQKGKKDDYFKKVTCIAEAKRLGRHLDKRLKTESDPFEVQIPSMQISKYLWLTGVKWGILTDGKYWRLYERETSKRLDIFYEVNLEDLIESGSPEDFRYFYLLFRKDAFLEFIEKVFKGSVDYAEAVGEKLKENIYQALKTLAQGFLKTTGSTLSEEHLKEIHDNSLILLYRLLFILYAEYRDLLPLGVNRLYTESYSLDAFKKEVANRLDKMEPIAASTFGYWNKLKELFEIINKGNRELGVPPYNGGLFDLEKHNFLENHRVGDLYVAKAIDLLSRSSDKAYIDYGSLEIRHLGSIYEGLLEYKLKIADKDLVPVKNKGKEVFVSLDEAKKQKKTIKEDEKINAGEIYLVTDKGERKATGSYYTPDYIVKYIVENTLGPLIEEKRKKVSEKIDELKQEVKGTKGVTREFHEKELRKTESSLIDEILSLKVLDPAMGSGHFLVEATDFLARELLRILSGEPLAEHSKEMVVREASVPYGLTESEEEDIRWARREVVERCIFGVDLNLMAVELAKLSLWLYTVAKNRPLNFLDHHLRCGNSLIGAKIDDLANPPEVKKKKVEGESTQLGLFESIFKEKVNILLGAFAQIEMLPSDTVEQVREKEKLYHDFRNIVSRFQDVADVWTGAYFGSDLHSGNYQKLQNRLRSTDEEWERLSQEEWFKRAKEIGNEKRFFHWELEFPEIFFEGHQRKENPGFDAVLGNPPYINAIELNRILSPFEKPFWKTRFTSASGAYDVYILFFEVGLQLLAIERTICLITPNKFLSAPYALAFREYIISSHQLISLCDWSRTKVFEDPSVYPVVTIFKKLGKASPEYQISTIEADSQNVVKEKERIHRSSCLSMLPEILWSFLLSSHFDLVLKISSVSFPLNKIATVQALSTAAESDGFTKIIQNGNGPESLKLLNTGLIDRYSDLWGFEPLEHKGSKYQEPYLKINSKIVSESRREMYNLSKIVFSKMALRIEAFWDVNGEFASINTNGAFSSKYNLGYICCLANSRIMSFAYAEYFGALRMGGGYFQFQAPQLETLPIRRISFVTPKESREKLVKEAKNLYRGYLETKKPDTIHYFIGCRLTKQCKPDGDLVKKHNADPLDKDWQISEGIPWEQSDVVHDVLTFLAEQMIEMNKEKQEEIKGYLKWLESQLKIQSDTKGNTGIEALTGRTQIKNYLGDYQKGEEHLPFEEFWKMLEKNKGRIQANLKSRELYENIISEYEKSLSKLLPLKEKLRKTDWLIDQIVYKLYGLTNEEIKIVEENR